jgi:V/A-type H+-transporting ATPase subunit A
VNDLNSWFEKNASPSWPKLRDRAMSLLQKESELKDIVQLVGPESLSAEDQVVMIVAKMLREDYLQQNAFHEVDAFCSVQKQFAMLDLIMSFNNIALDAVKAGKDVRSFANKNVVTVISRMKYEEEKSFLKSVDKIKADIKKQLME